VDPLAYVQFTDTEWRPVYEDESGQFVIDDDDGSKVRGLWYIPPEECVFPIIVRAAPE